MVYGSPYIYLVSSSSSSHRCYFVLYVQISVVLTGPFHLYSVDRNSSNVPLNTLSLIWTGYTIFDPDYQSLKSPCINPEFLTVDNVNRFLPYPMGPSFTQNLICSSRICRWNHLEELGVQRKMGWQHTKTLILQRPYLLPPLSTLPLLP